MEPNYEKFKIYYNVKSGGRGTSVEKAFDHVEVFDSLETFKAIVFTRLLLYLHGECFEGTCPTPYRLIRSPESTIELCSSDPSETGLPTRTVHSVNESIKELLKRKITIALKSSNKSQREDINEFTDTAYNNLITARRREVLSTFPGVEDGPYVLPTSTTRGYPPVELVDGYPKRRIQCDTVLGERPTTSAAVSTLTPRVEDGPYVLPTSTTRGYPPVELVDGYPVSVLYIYLIRPPQTQTRRDEASVIPFWGNVLQLQQLFRH
ncbi:hypothetical protein ADUPG1_000402 [Aduncisulcus paluster]|uniref:Uncharacterized protein n=1 Tax=Aduncisulcus paluster TaxID=2918883 RepID=A0ABQ5KA62_9EUKA|nr:hypothetical protein ADUPG1_000402 [Aduncisulcus paluster]